MILKKSRAMTKLRKGTSVFSFAVRKLPERGVDSLYLSRTKRPSVLAGESNLTALASVCAAALSRGVTY
jgi:hypothetical protein